ncbi:MAG: CDP-alcohol phosphatidyltransferase family protein [Ignavibacteria bacterium]|nr:CDP-alcohol phosphatidyltransferase family protein [Ignavibacteria bacterium]
MNASSESITAATRKESVSSRVPSETFFTISNLLSVTRALLAVPFVFVMISSQPSSRVWGGIIMAVAALTDKLDGVLARKYKQMTEWGKILDPLADKIGVITVVFVLLYLDVIPVWFVAAVLARDVLILAGGLYFKAKRGVVLASNEAGKWAVGIISLTLFLLVVGVQSIVTSILLVASTILLSVSLGLYFKRFVDVIQTGKVR